MSAAAERPLSDTAEGRRAGCGAKRRASAPPECDGDGKREDGKRRRVDGRVQVSVPVPVPVPAPAPAAPRPAGRVLRRRRGRERVRSSMDALSRRGAARVGRCLGAAEAEAASALTGIPHLARHARRGAQVCSTSALRLMARDAELFGWLSEDGCARVEKRVRPRLWTAGLLAGRLRAGEALARGVKVTPALCARLAEGARWDELRACVDADAKRSEGGGDAVAACRAALVAGEAGRPWVLVLAVVTPPSPDERAAATERVQAMLTGVTQAAFWADDLDALRAVWATARALVAFGGESGPACAAPCAARLASDLPRRLLSTFAALRHEKAEPSGVAPGAASNWVKRRTPPRSLHTYGSAQLRARVLGA